MSGKAVSVVSMATRTSLKSQTSSFKLLYPTYRQSHEETSKLMDHLTCSLESSSNMNSWHLYNSVMNIPGAFITRHLCLKMMKAISGSTLLHHTKLDMLRLCIYDLKRTLFNDTRLNADTRTGNELVPLIQSHEWEYITSIMADSFDLFRDYSSVLDLNAFEKMIGKFRDPGLIPKAIDIIKPQFGNNTYIRLIFLKCLVDSKQIPHMINYISSFLEDPETVITRNEMHLILRGLCYHPTLYITHNNTKQTRSEYLLKVLKKCELSKEDLHHWRLLMFCLIRDANYKSAMAVYRKLEKPSTLQYLYDRACIGLRKSISPANRNSWEYHHLITAYLNNLMFDDAMSLLQEIKNNKKRVYAVTYEKLFMQMARFERHEVFTVYKMYKDDGHVLNVYLKNIMIDVAHKLHNSELLEELDSGDRDHSIEVSRDGFVY